MRRTRNSGDKSKKFMVYFMAFIMVGSLFGIIFFGFTRGGSSSIKYNDFKFINRGNFWSTNVDGREALFTYLPTDLELIVVDDVVINRLKNLVELDLTSEYNDTFAEGIALAQYQLGITLNNFNIFVVNGFTRENNANSPIITCDTATVNVPVIYFKSGNTTKIYLENNCIIAEASVYDDVIRLKDRLAYGMLGIIK